MRPQQQGRRQRNRGGNNNNRRNQNPLSRSYESNGPDVKIRGNPQVIADKYTQLARDAMASGDTVMAENYYQHAEHYNRIIMAAQPPREENRDDSRDDANDDNDNRNEGDEDLQDARQQDRDDNNNSDNGRRRNRNDRGNRKNSDDSENGVDASESPQPVLNGTPAEVALGEDQSANGEDAPKPRKRRPRKVEAKTEDAVADAAPAGADKSEMAEAGEA